VGANTATYSDSGRAPNTTYTYRVRAVNFGGASAYSNEASAATLPLPPSAPSSLTAAPLSSSSMSLAWKDNADNETGFKIERKNADGSFTQVGTTGTNVTGYRDSGLLAGTAYTYQVRATNSGGDSPYSPEATGTTLPDPPNAPPNLTATAISSSEIDL